VHPLDAEDVLRGLLRRAGVETAEVHHAFVGRGEDALAAWEAFKAVAAMPADEAFQDVDGESCYVDVAGDGDLLLFEAALGERRPAKGWRSLGEPPEPTVFIMDFTRQFSFHDADGEELWMNGLTLTVEFRAHPDLTGLDRAQLWGRGGPRWTEQPGRGRGERRRPLGAAPEWIDEVEHSKPFAAAFGHHRATRFFFGQGDY
jgi:hypothetical protein